MQLNSINRYNYELNCTIDDATISLMSTPIMTFTLNAIVDILIFNLAIKYNYQLGKLNLNLNYSIIIYNYLINRYNYMTLTPLMIQLLA